MISQLTVLRIKWLAGVNWRRWGSRLRSHFALPSPEGRTEYVRTPVDVLLYTNIEIYNIYIIDIHIL